MDYTTFDLDGLSTLWLASGGNLKVKNELETELARRTINNQNFSIEYLYQVSILRNHALGINLIPTSDAYNRFGANITVRLLLSEDKLDRIAANHASNPPINSYGNVKFTVLAQGNLNENQITDLSNIGLDTSNILGVMHVN